jgi:hypothetical protein
VTLQGAECGLKNSQSSYDLAIYETKFLLRKDALKVKTPQQVFTKRVAMSHISRRRFFEFAGSTLAALGLSQLNIQRQAESYGKVLAQSTPRKLALLVGINQYSFSPLDGCLNDVELQRHLLIHRFGFNPKDIYTLTDEKATRSGILQAFEEHLIRQANEDGTVFSIINSKGKVTLRSRDGLVGVATVEGTAAPGMLLRKIEGLSTGI